MCLFPVSNQPYVWTKPIYMKVRVLLEYRQSFGKATRQRNVRGDYTKDKAGTLPLYMYSESHISQNNTETFEFNQCSQPQNVLTHKTEDVLVYIEDNCIVLLVKPVKDTDIFEAYKYTQQDHSPLNFEKMNEIPVKIQESSILKTVDKNDIDLEEQNEIVIVEAFYNDFVSCLEGRMTLALKRI